MQELPIDNDLQKCGVTRLTKEGNIMFIVCKGKPVIFRIQKEGLLSTLDEFEKNSEKGHKIDKPTQQAIILTLSQGDYQGIIQNNGGGDIAAATANTVKADQNQIEALQQNRKIRKKKLSLILLKRWIPSFQTEIIQNL
jgi:hypothetical protein